MHCSSACRDFEHIPDSVPEVSDQGGIAVGYALYGAGEECGIAVLLFDAYGGRVVEHSLEIDLEIIYGKVKWMFDEKCDKL